MISFSVKSLLFTLALIVCLGALNPARLFYSFNSNIIGVCFAEDNVNISFMDTRIREELSLKKNLITFNKVSGMLSTTLKEQKRLFIAKNGDQKNETAWKAENLINEASLFASQSNYNESLKVLETVHNMIMTSLKELHRIKK